MILPAHVRSSSVILAAAVLIAGAAAACGEIVVLRDGRKYAGVCHSSGKEISVATGMKTSFIPRAAVETVLLSDGEKGELERLKAGMLSADKCVTVAKWLDDHLQYDDAETYYKKALDLDPDHPAARKALGFRREGKNWVGDPSKQLDRALMCFGDAGALACLRIGKEYAEKGQAKNAEIALRRALVINPEQPEAIHLFEPYIANYKAKNSYRRPIDGRILGVSGADHHLTAYMYNAIDFVKTDEAGKINSADGTKLEDYYTYGVPAVAAAAGEVVAVVDGHPDQPIGRPGPFLDANSVALRHANGEFTLYAHLKAKSIVVHKGDSVRAGQVLGLIGNSGSSASPHLHFCLYDIDGISLPITFADEKPATQAP